MTARTQNGALSLVATEQSPENTTKHTPPSTISKAIRRGPDRRREKIRRGSFATIRNGSWKREADIPVFEFDFGKVGIMTATTVGSPNHRESCLSTAVSIVWINGREEALRTSS